MMNPLTHTPDDLREAFYELATASPKPDADALDALVRLYPQYAEELTAFAIDLTVDALVHDDEVLVGEESEAVNPSVARAMSAYHNRLFELNRKAANSAVDRAASDVVENPFLGLDRTAIRALSEGIGANPTFISKLRDRMIEISTISLGFQKLVAEKLGVPLQALAAHLSAQTAVQAPGQHFKADQKPVLGMKQTFEEAVRSSGLSESQQQHLLSL